MRPTPDSGSARAAFAAIGIFLLVASFAAGLAAFTLFWRGTQLDRVWNLNPTAYVQLLPRAKVFGTGFLVLSVALFAAAVGWFRRRRWGWKLAVAIISIQVLGDAANCLRGDYLRGAAGFLIAGALLVYLLRSSIRNAFQRKTS